MGATTTRWAWGAVLACACKPVDPAPADVDGLAHWFWEQFEAGDDATLSGGIENLHAAIDGDSFGEVLEGELTSLSDDDAALVGLDVDASQASGVYVGDLVGCSSAQVDAVIAYEHQDELYTGVYDSYERVSSTSVGDYLSGDTDTLTWDLDYSTTIVGVSYAARSHTVMRRVHDRDFDEPVVLVRAHLREPAVFANPNSENYFDQDYHLEIYWPDDGGLLHVYANWKDIRISGFEDEGESTQRLILNNLIQWDEGTTQLCEEGRP